MSKVNSKKLVKKSKQKFETDPSQSCRPEGKKFMVSAHRAKARGKIRYVETNDLKKNCKFL